jgi:uncharacterized damage-inducible protein DinB
MKYHFAKLMNYEVWANEQVIQALQSLDRPDTRSLELLSHILAAHLTWYNRAREVRAYIPLWETKDFSECVIMLRNITQRWQELIDQSEELTFGRTVSYTNSKDETHFSSLYEILTHLMLHSGYHRGQLVSHLKGKMQELPVTDFIVFAREEQESKWY